MIFPIPCSAPTAHSDPHARILLPAYSKADINKDSPQGLSRPEFVSAFVNSYRNKSVSKTKNGGWLIVTLGCEPPIEEQTKQANKYFDKINFMGKEKGIDTNFENISLNEYKKFYNMMKGPENLKFNLDESPLIRAN
jgi:hypothetical protein